MAWVRYTSLIRILHRPFVIDSDDIRRRWDSRTSRRRGRRWPRRALPRRSRPSAPVRFLLLSFSIFFFRFLILTNKALRERWLCSTIVFYWYKFCFRFLKNFKQKRSRWSVEARRLTRNLSPNKYTYVVGKFIESYRFSFFSFFFFCLI